MSAKAKRRYTRLSVTEWDSITSIYSTGVSTLPEIAAKYSVSIGAILNQAKLRGNTRRGAFPAASVLAAASAGAPASAVAALAPSAARSPAKPSAATHEARVIESNEAAYIDSMAVQRLVRMAIAALPTPTTPAEAAATIRCCDMAITALDRANRIRRAVLRIDKGEGANIDVPLPELPITEMSDLEVDAMRAKQEQEDREQGYQPPTDIEDPMQEEEIDIVDEGK